jgi:predicted GNAT family acetyltransferase
MSSRPVKVTHSRFEIEEDGHVAFLEFQTDGDWITLLHTEVPPELRERGMGSELARTALDYARDHHLKVDVICPFVADFIAKHPQYKPSNR